MSLHSTRLRISQYFGFSPVFPQSSQPQTRSRQSGSRQNGAAAHAHDAPVSLFLYLAGLIVTLAGLYAVNFGIEDPNFANLTYGLATSGYVVSYLLRVRRVDTQMLHIPILVGVGLVALSTITSGHGLGWLAPAGMEEDKSKSLQLLVAWIAIVQSFLLGSDAAILFACVPCMSMLAIVSTTNSDPHIQNAFLLFIGASTFMMVHENYMRTRMSKVMGRSRNRDQRLFRGQIALTALCLVGAVVLANFVAFPMRSLGQTLAETGALNAITPQAQKNPKQNGVTVTVSEKNSVDLGTGPVTENDMPLMQVQAPAGPNWRGTTYDYYTGHTFKSTDQTMQPLSPHLMDPARGPDPNTATSTDDKPSLSEMNRYEVPLSPLELDSSDMRDSKRITQRVTLLVGTYSALYGAGKVEEIHEASGSITQLSSSSAGSLLTAMSMTSHLIYEAVSNLPSSDPAVLRAASSDRSAFPPAIRRTYLQTASETNPENARLHALANQITRGATNNYDRAEAIKNYISSTCSYNLNTTRAPQDQDVVEYFLTVSKQGYCDSFGAAMTMLCRYAGVPARLASGFICGELQHDRTTENTYLVREKDKHLWCEVFFPHVGWVTFDATENAPDITDRTQHAGSSHRTDFLTWFRSHGILPPLFGGMFILLLGYLVKTELIDRIPTRTIVQKRLQDRPPTNSRIIQTYCAAGRLLSSHGLTRPGHQTADEYLSTVQLLAAAAMPEAVGALSRLTALYTRSQYGGAVATEAEVQQAQSALESIKTALAKVKRGTLTEAARPITLPGVKSRA